MSTLLAQGGAGVGELVFSGSLLIALPIALAAGLVSFFSPCCLPLVPGFLGYVSGLAGTNAAPAPPASRRGNLLSRSAPAQPTGLRSRVLIGSGLFVLGFAAVFTSYGALFGGVGSLLRVHQEALVRVLGVVTILLGLLFLGAFSRMSWAGRTFRLPYRPAVGLAGAPVLGVLFGVGWTPCIGPTLAAVLGLAIDTGTASRGALLAFTYSLGLGLPFIAVALGLQRALRVLAFARRHARWVARSGGALLVAVGIMQVTGMWTSLIASMQGLIGGFQTPL